MVLLFQCRLVVPEMPSSPHHKRGGNWHLNTVLLLSCRTPFPALPSSLVVVVMVIPVWWPDAKQHADNHRRRRQCRGVPLTHLAHYLPFLLMCHSISISSIIALNITFSDLGASSRFHAFEALHCTGELSFYFSVSTFPFLLFLFLSPSLSPFCPFYRAN